MDIDSQTRAVPANCEGLHFILRDGEPGALQRICELSMAGNKVKGKKK